MAEELKQDQPKPKFTLVDLEAKLTDIYNGLHAAIKGIPGPNPLSIAQELLAIVSKCKNDLDSIDMPIDSAKAITETLDTEKPAFVVCGVQLYEHGKLVGTSLYSTVSKARQIRNVLNQRFAELKVNHEAKIINYPVY